MIMLCPPVNVLKFGLKLSLFTENLLFSFHGSEDLFCAVVLDLLK